MHPLRFDLSRKRKDQNIMKNWIKAHRKLLWLALAAVVLFAALGTLTYFNHPAANAGAKHITVAVVDGARNSTLFTIPTDALYLRPALEQQNLIAGEQTDFGLFVKTVNGITADDTKQQWWCFTKGGQSVMTGVDTTPIADGDAFEITLTTGY